MIEVRLIIENTCVSNNSKNIVILEIELPEKEVRVPAQKKAAKKFIARSIARKLPKIVSLTEMHIDGYKVVIQAPRKPRGKITAADIPPGFDADSIAEGLI